MNTFSFAENIKVALAAIRSHLLRTVLTILIIAFGIMALVGILTAIDSIKNAISFNFSRLGANSFTIRSQEMRGQTGSSGRRANVVKRITFDEALRFKESFNFPAQVSITFWGTGTATVKHGSKTTHPNVSVNGSDENYLFTSGYELERGRNFSAHEIFPGANVVIIGKQLSKKLFSANEEIVGSFISINSVRYQVIGVLKEKGASFGFSGDNSCIIPIQAVRQQFSRSEMNYAINISTLNIENLESAIFEATGHFRIIRGLLAGEEDDFRVVKSDQIAQMLIENIKYVTLAATLIGLITLMGAAIGLMNIMLVSVTERTREIGVRKALGATRKVIKTQFLMEAIVICQLGGLAGIVLGIIAGNGVSMIFDSPFILPWKWILLGISLCFAVGLVAGYYPAAKASKLDPIDALRYE